MGLLGRFWSVRSVAQNAQVAVREALNTAATVRRAAHQAQAAAVERDLAKADVGDARAQYELGERFYCGLGVPRDFAQAATWFRLAAQQGHPEAQCTLGMMCFLGRGVARDYAEAYQWLSLAAAAGNERAAQALTKAKKRFAPEEISEGQRRTASFRRVIPGSAPKSG